MSPAFQSKNFILGITLQLGAILFYVTVTQYTYYGGGWPFVQIIFAVPYIMGVRYIFKSEIPRYLKLIINFWWVGWLVFSILEAILGH